MPAQRLSVGTRFAWDDVPYEIRRLLAGQKAIIEDVRTGEAQTVALATLEEALFAGGLRLEIPQKLARRAKAKDGAEAVVPTESKLVGLDDLPETLAHIAHFRLWCIRPLLALHRRSRTKQVVRDRAAEVARMRRADLPEEFATVSSDLLDLEHLQKHLSHDTLYRWMRHYRKSGGDIRALVPDLLNCGAPRASRLDPEVNRIIENTIREAYLKPARASITHVHQLVSSYIEDANKTRYEGEKLKTPARSTIARRIEELDVVEKFAAHHGKLAARRKYKQYGTSQEPTLANELWEFDSTRLDLILIDEVDNLPMGRPTLTVALDRATRAAAGYSISFEGASYLSVMDAIYHAILPKGDVRGVYGTENEWTVRGVPASVRLDNGKEYRNRHMRDTCESLGTAIQYTRVRTPNEKGAIESFIGSLATMLIHTLPGTTFSNTRQRGEYDSVAEACISFDELHRVFVIFLVDVYMQSYHRGLKGVPARRWEQQVDMGFMPRLPESAESLRILLSRVDERVLQHYGIEFENLVYQDPRSRELASLRARHEGEKLKIKYDPADLARIFVFDPDERRYIEVPAQAQEQAAGISLWKHRILCRNALIADGKTDPAALGRARRRIQEVVDAARHRRDAGTNIQARVSRWNMGGRSTPGTPPNPQAMRIVDVTAKTAESVVLPGAQGPLGSGADGVIYLPDDRAQTLGPGNSTKAADALPAGRASETPPESPDALPNPDIFGSLSLSLDGSDAAENEGSAIDGGFFIDYSLRDTMK
jgi:putative transposase